MIASVIITRYEEVQAPQTFKKVFLFFSCQIHTTDSLRFLQLSNLHFWPLFSATYNLSNFLTIKVQGSYSRAQEWQIGSPGVQSHNLMSCKPKP